MPTESFDKHFVIRDPEVARRFLKAYSEYRPVYVKPVDLDKQFREAK